MIYEFIGGGLVLISCTLFGVMLKLRYNKRIDELENLFDCIDVIEHEISENLSDMVHVFNRLLDFASDYNFELFKKFLETSKMSDGIPLSEVWTRCVKNIKLSSSIYEKKDIDILLMLSNILEASNTSTQIDNLKKIKYLLNDRIKDSKKLCEKISVSSKLGFYFGLAIIIILI